MKQKIFGSVLAAILIIGVFWQIKQAGAQLADEPITGPITSPITGPLLSPTESLTPSITPSATPTETPTPSMTLTPTPTYAPGTRLGGLNLLSYCDSTSNPSLNLTNGTWSCGNDTTPIDMTAACNWQYGISNAVANQDIQGNAYSWTCYVQQLPMSPTPTITPSETPTPSEVLSPTVTPTCTPTPIENTNYTYKSVKLPVSFFHFPAGFPFVGFINTANFFNHTHYVAKQHTQGILSVKVCTNHDKP